MKQLRSIENEFGNARKKAEQFQGATKGIGEAAKQAGKGAEKGATGLGKFAKSLGRIALYRGMRTILKELTQSFREGLENAYLFSKGIGGDLAAAMDSLATKSLTMKNQMGAAFGALLTAIMPVVLKIIEFVTRAANAITQLFAVLGGKSGYKKAIDASQQWAKSTAGGAKAAKEWKNQLMGFDEINRLDAPEEPSGGGGGGAATNVGEMFEWSKFDEWTEKLKPLKEQLDELWNTIKEGAISSWDYIKKNVDFYQFFTDIVTTVRGVVELVSGILSGDWTLAFQGAADIVTGFGGIVDQVLGFIGGIVVSLVDWVGNLIMSLLNYIEEKTGISLDGLKKLVSGLFSTVKILLTDLLSSIRRILHGVVEFIAGVFTNDWSRAWDGVKEVFIGILRLMYSIGTGIINSIISVFNSAIGFVSDVVKWFGGKGFNFQFNLLETPKFASGGFPEDGMFMANHGELVGQFTNGQTAVANNAEIVAGIERGVYNAMSSVMASQNQRPIENRVYLDGKEIGASVRRYERNTNRATGVTYG